MGVVEFDSYDREQNQLRFRHIMDLFGGAPKKPLLVAHAVDYSFIIADKDFGIDEDYARRFLNTGGREILFARVGLTNFFNNPDTVLGEKDFKDAIRTSLVLGSNIRALELELVEKYRVDDVSGALGSLAMQDPVPSEADIIRHPAAWHPE